MNIKRFFLRINIFICLYNDILSQNLNISKIAIYHPPRPCWPRKKSISHSPYLIVHNSLVKYSPICLECVKNFFYGNKMKLKWRNYLKQKICRTERKFIKLREEAKKPVSQHHNGDPFKDRIYRMHYFYLSHQF